MNERKIDIESLPYHGMSAKLGKTILRYTVTGRGSFPHDMLRYDRSWPATESDARLLDDFVFDHYRDRRSGHAFRIIGLNVTPKRWESFGWTVSNLIEHKLWINA